jgi:hypothetical protein
MIKDFMVEFFKTSFRKHLLEKKKGKPISYQLLMVVISKGKIKEND